jgi:hypothetical protein
MARKKPARTAKKAKKQAKKKGASRPAARKIGRKSKSKPTRKAAKKSPAKRAARPARKSARKPAPKAAARKPQKAATPARATAAKAKPAAKKRGSLLASAAAAAVGSALAAGVKAALGGGVKGVIGGGKKPNLDRPRKTVADVHGIPSSLDMDRTASAARTGRAELQERLNKNTSASPALTSGDVDADWESAATVGDEAPGGDNPTPDQDVVDDIGRALGVEYDDDEELQGGEEIADRDRNRWELDPSSKEDLDEEES